MQIPKICPLTLADLSAIVQLEASVSQFPWSKKAHQDSIEQNYPSLGLKLEDKLIGLIVFNFLADECHLLNIAVAQNNQGQGYAQLLIEAMLQKALAEDISSVILEVRRANHVAIQLYLKLGFEQIGERKNYYRGNSSASQALESAREDAIVMQKAL